MSPGAFVAWLRRSPFGPVAVVWSIGRGRPGVDRIVLSAPGAPAAAYVRGAWPGAEESSCGEVAALVTGLEALLAGDDVRIPLESVRLDGCSPFQRRVLRAEYEIPRGRVSSYRLLAGRLGLPGGARAVGRALATNPFPLVIPCHRVVRSDGGLGGYQGGAPMKRALLEMEGVPFRESGHVADGAFVCGAPGADR